MIFNELRFLLFFAAVFALHWALPNARARKLLLLVASYAFYAAWDPRFLALIGLSTALDFGLGLALAAEAGEHRRRLLVGASLAVNLGVLALFKYADFFIASAADLARTLGLETSPASLGLILPVGISFYTFQTLSYTLDLYRRRIDVCRDPLDFALFVGFFPQLVAGPIVRASEFLPQLRRARSFAAVAWRPALTLFLFGYVKKACIADRVAAVVDPTWAAAPELGAALLWLAAVLYFVQIYCDFSGYSDMAIASAALLGYQLPLNFRFPMLAVSVTQFWRRWHISLSSWFRDYLYLPLGGNRGGRWHTYRNLCAVFFLCALWHGAAWTFIAWGALHGLALVAERASGAAAWFERGPGQRLVGWTWTFGLALAAWVCFRAPSLAAAGHYLAGMLGRGAAAAASGAGVEGWQIGCIAGAVFLTAHLANALLGLERRLARIPELPFAFGLGVAWAAALAAAADGYRPFIYFQF